MDMHKKSQTLFEIAKQSRTPISCTVELTQKCNFYCPHCFIKGTGYTFLKYEDFVSFIDQFHSLGGVFLTLTGGEPLLHPEFMKIYLYAYNKGLSVTVFSNGYLIDDRLIDLFRTHPPRKIEISIYGADNESYYKVSKQKNAYSKVVKNIDKLIENNCIVNLKTTLFQEIYYDFFKIKRLAEQREIPFRYDFKLMPKRNGEKDNLKHQLSPNKIINLELLDDPKKILQWTQNYKTKNVNIHSKQKDLFNCGAGRYSCFLNSKNQVQICAAASFSAQSMSHNTFAEIWKDFEKYTKLLMNPQSLCLGCDKAALCDICPIWGYVINDDINCLGKEVDIHCALAKERLDMINNEEN